MDVLRRWAARLPEIVENVAALTANAEARALFADFDTVSPVPKFAMRPALACSQTLPMRQRMEDAGMRTVVVEEADHLLRERKQLVAYRDGSRKNAIMSLQAENLSNEDIAVLAAHYGN